MNRIITRNPIAFAFAFTFVCLLLGSLLIASASAQYSQAGGISATGSDVPKGKRAKLRRDGRAIPPRRAPKRIKRMIRAANRIDPKPYKYGGGHSRWKDNGYDCSGAVSYVLRAGKRIRQPMASGGLARWGKAGRGKWVTVYAHGGHAYMTIAGLRFDTSMTPGDGPGWSDRMRSSRGFAARTHKGL